MTDDLDTAPLWFGDYERRLNARFDLIDARLAGIEERLEALEAGQAQLKTDLTLLRKDNRRLEEKVNVFVEEVIALSRKINRAEGSA